MARLLITGMTADEAVAVLTLRGVSESEAFTAAQQMSRSPLLGPARGYWNRLQSREWFFATQAKLGERLHAFDRLGKRRSIDRREFLETYYYGSRPLLLRGIARKWRAVREWGRDYLKSVCGDQLVRVMFNRTKVSVPHQNTGMKLQRTIRFGDYLDLVFNGGPSNDYYLVSRNKFFSRQGTRKLLEDLGRLPFVDTRAKKNGVRLWLGPGGTITPLHYDDKNNCLVQVVGKKRVRLYAPCFGEFMQQQVRWYAKVDPTNAVMPRGIRRPREIGLTLRPGDALFIPVGWWHAVYADEPSITLSFFDFGAPNKFEAR